MRSINSLMYMMNYGDPFGMMGALRGVMVFLSVIAIVLGLAQLLWGYKLLRFWIAVQGFGIGGVIGSLIAIFVFFRSRGSVGMVMGLILILVCAVLGAFLAYMLYKVGVFLQCFACGFLVALVLFGVLFHSMGFATVLGFMAGVALGVLGVFLTKPMFIITTSVTGGLNCGMALGTIFGNPVIGFVLALGLIGLGLWYQITHNNGLFEVPGEGIPGVKKIMAAGTVDGAAAGTVNGGTGGMPVGAASGPAGLPSSMQLPPITWRLQWVLICVGISAAATFVLVLFRSRYGVFLEPGRKFFSSILWAVAVTGAAGYIWRGNFSRESGSVEKDQLLGIAVTAVPTIIVCMVLWQIYFTPSLYRMVGFRGVFLGFLFALKRTLLYLVPVLTLGILWKQKVPTPLLYRPEKEDINRMTMGAAVVGGAMVGIHVLSLLGSMLFMHGRFSFRTVFYLFCYVVGDVVTAAAMTYVWGRQGIYTDTEEDKVPVSPAAAGAVPAGQGAAAKASPLLGVPAVNTGSANPAQQPIQTSKFRRKITAGMVKAENTHEYWREGAPLALTQMTLTEQAGQLSLTLGLQNLGQGIVNAIYVDIDCYNVLKERVAQLKDVSFLDLKVGRGNIFFNSIPVQIPDATVRQCDICLRHVVFADEAIWNGDEGQFLEKLEPQKYLAGEDGMKPELADEFCRIMAGNRGKGLADMKRLYLYTPEQREGYWYCSCGQINLSGEDICSACGIDRDEMFAMLSPEFLTQVRADRLEEERQRMEEEARLKAERIAERNRKIEETKAAARKKAQELVSHGKNCYEKGSEKVQGYVSGIGAAKDNKAETKAPGSAQICPNCKTVCQPGNLFCISCGTPLTQPEAGVSQPVSEAGVPQPLHEQTAGQPAPETGLNQSVIMSEVPQPMAETGLNQSVIMGEVPQPMAETGVTQSVPVSEVPQPVPGAGIAQPIHEPAAGQSAPLPPVRQKPCPSCKAMCGADDVFCINCGARLQQEAPQKKICPNCSRENKATAKFCIGCGTKLGE